MGALYLVVPSLAGIYRCGLFITDIFFLRGFSVPSFAKRIAAKNNCTLEKAMKYLWGDHYYDPDVSITFLKYFASIKITPSTHRRRSGAKQTSPPPLAKFYIEDSAK